MKQILFFLLIAFSLHTQGQQTQASAISSPAEGLLVYVTNTNGTFTAKGWWGWDGAAWQKLNN